MEEKKKESRRGRLRRIRRLFQEEEFAETWLNCGEAEFEARLRKLKKLLKEWDDNDYNQKLLVIEARMKALQNQINPHFLYNTLDVIRGYALMQDCVEVAEMTEALSTMFRYNIGKPGDMATLKEELENVENYFLIQRYRFGDKFRLEKEIEEEELLLDYCLPRLTIQPLVENAIHHGLEHKAGIGTVRIHAYRTDRNLIVRISDNGEGMDQETLLALRKKLARGTEFAIEPRSKGKSGIAVVNLNQRLKLAFGDSYGVTVSSIEHVGSFFTIVVPASAQTEPDAPAINA